MYYIRQLNGDIYPRKFQNWAAAKLFRDYKIAECYAKRRVIPHLSDFFTEQLRDFMGSDIVLLDGDSSLDAEIR